jgi:RNA polymerase sigma factor (TIGR02999 family)
MHGQLQPGDVTQLLLRWGAGDSGALEALLPLVYGELRTLARRHLARERGSHTLQRTALVHEAFLRMVDQTRVDWKSRSQFLCLASQMMRRVLVDHARRRGSAKRGSGAQRVSLDVVLANDEGAEGRSPDAAVASRPAEGDDVDFEAIHDALQRLERLDPTQGRLVELRFFGGLSIHDASAILDISPATAKREWAIARAWLHRELESRGGA